MRTAARPRSLIAVLIVVIAAAAALAQVGGFGGFGFGGRARFQVQPNARYDGRFTFVRVNYESAPGGYWYRGLPSWAHGYPMAEQNLMKIMNEVSYLGANEEEINTLALDDPELFKYPVAYIIEVSWWTLTDAQAAALRAYMQKGGFVIVDDFKADRRFRQPRLGAVRGEHAARAARRALRRDAGRRIRSSTAFFEIDDAATSSRRPTTPGRRCFAASTRTTIRPSGCR